jgi:hypothetical protein
MALFGDTMTEVVTPDGRRITMPQQLAQSFPGLQPAPPIGPPPGAPQATELPAIPDFAPQPPPAAPPVRPPGPDAAASPVTSPAQVALDGPPAPRGPVTAPQPGPDVQGANTPGPVTEAQLAKMGTAGAANAEMAAQDATREATRRQGEALADQATTIGNEMAAANDEAARLLAERKAAADAHAAALQAETDKYLRNAKAIADTKIDRKADHPVLAALSIALSGIGAAMAGDGSRNPALDMFFKAIDRKVAGQLQDLDQKRAGLATQKEGLGLMRQAGMDKLAEMDTYRLGYLEQAKRQVETIKQQTQSDVVRANADVALAGIDQEKAKTLSTAVDRFQTRQEQKEARAQQERHHRSSLAVQMRGQDMQQRESDLNREERRQEKLDERAAQLHAMGQKDKAEKVKAVSAQSIGDPTSGGDILQPEGQAKIKEATKLERSAEKFAAAAAAETDPDKRKALETRAAAEKQRAFDIRTEVESDPKMTWTVGDDKSRREVGTKIATGQTIASTADEIKLLREQHGPKWLTTSEGQAFMQSKGTAVLMALKDAWGLGVLSALDVELLNKATGGDPAKLTLGDVSNFLGAEGVASRLDGLVDTMEQGVRNEMRTLKFRGDYKFKRDRDERTPEEKAAIAALSGPTPIEAADKYRKSSAFTRVTEGLASKFEADDSPARRIERSGHVEEVKGADGTKTLIDRPGLSKSQAPAVGLNLKAYKAGLNSDDEKAQRASARAASLLVKLATDKTRPSMRDAMLTSLQRDAPELYEKALAALPDELRSALKARDQLQRNAPGALPAPTRRLP